MAWLLVVTVIINGHIKTHTVAYDINGQYRDPHSCNEDLVNFMEHARAEKGVAFYASCETVEFWERNQHQETD